MKRICFACFFLLGLDLFGNIAYENNIVWFYKNCDDGIAITNSVVPLEAKEIPDGYGQTSQDDDQKWKQKDDKKDGHTKTAKAYSTHDTGNQRVIPRPADMQGLGSFENRVPCNYSLLQDKDVLSPSAVPVISHRKYYNRASTL
jgi:hypothetical protein